ncbi:MAG: glutathione S-transferase family protein [Pseudomonadota bacterium]
MKLFGHPDSGHVYKVRLLLCTNQIAHDYETVDIFAPRESRSQEFQTSARFGEVPTLLDGDQSMSQSNAILVHLARRFGQWGAESEHRLQRVLEWLFWEANKIGMCLPQLRADRLFADSKLETEARVWLLRRYQHDIDVLDRRLAKTGAFVIDQSITIADYSICGYLFFAEDAEVEMPANVTTWLNRLRDLTGWAPPKDLLSA